MAVTRSFRSPKPETLLFAAVLVSAAAFSFPELWRLLRTARDLAPLPYAERRERLMDYYSSLRHAKRQLAEGERVAIVMMRDDELGRGVFSHYYLYPRPSRLFYGLDGYRRTLVPPPAKTLLRVDARRGEMVRVMSYAEIRREAINGRPIVRDPQPSNEALGGFVVPLVASVDGAPPDSYTTEAVLVAEEAAQVTFTLFPGGQQRTFALERHQPLRFTDVVDDSFGVMTQGWLRVTSSAPLRAGFWFVNRGAGKAVPLPATNRLPLMPLRLPGGERLWLLNTADRAAAVRINGAAVTLPPRGLWTGPSAPENTIEGEGAIFPFTSTKLRDGNTAFFWPEHAP